MSRTHWSPSVAIAALFGWVAIAATIVAVGMNPVLAALAASVVVFDLFYYHRKVEGVPIVSSS